MILQNCTGYVKAGQSLAIMGPSGAGKTTLLSLITKRLEKSNDKIDVQGQVFINEYKYNSQEFSNVAAFILQDDILMETLTVKETITFAARLKLNLCQKQIKEKVEQIIKCLKLENCQNNIIGGFLLKGISGGERKRTNIGVELVTDPQLIILDEPTSGLDSFTSFLLIKLLNDMCQQNHKTIIFTIHQPSSEIFNSLDRLILLRNGQTVYQGKAQDIVPYIKKQGIHYPQHCNPSDFFMEFLVNKQKQKNIKQDIFTYQNYQNQIEQQILNEVEFKGNYNKINFKQISKNSFFYETSIIAQRSYQNFIRCPQLFKIKTILLIFNSLLISTIFWKAAQKDYQSVNEQKIWQQQTMGCIYVFGVQTFCNIISTIAIIFPKERSVFLKEENSNFYRVSSYFVGKLLVELPYVIIYPIFSTVIMFFAVGFENKAFNTFLLIFILMSVIGNGIGLAGGAAFKNPQIVSILLPTLLMPFQLFGGFYSDQSRNSKYTSWIQYISPFYYMTVATTNAEFGDIYIYDDIQRKIIDNYDYPITQNESLIILLIGCIIFHIAAFIFLKLEYIILIFGQNMQKEHQSMQENNNEFEWIPCSSQIKQQNPTSTILWSFKPTLSLTDPQIFQDQNGESLNVPKNVYAFIFAVTAETKDLSNFHLIDIGLLGQTKILLEDGLATFSALKFSSTSYNNQGSKFNLVLAVGIQNEHDLHPKIISAKISSAVFVDSRKSARDKQSSKQSEKNKTFYDFFDPCQFTKKLTKIKVEDKLQSCEEISNDIQGFINYFTAANIRNKNMANKQKMMKVKQSKNLKKNKLLPYLLILESLIIQILKIKKYTKEE
ncbi:hypothetical protein IMG5_101460 [Ichthyophthirius multifiliis]|uniref:ABC transporter domain-containing protein n=1 Tax=Ichthyophthirius multifiliis TaxID=5932 RepID=G0QSJ4_ICHMU|nr:hypothetical protein IMG5_101460 [Ichthyophthirius multifiliis]EGR31832.1 hypothetical protein IMG5_101460 [Ichthyophthirius multifiliis]|eukprot:XP_004035318.1 hypothetical protein IMG5_101460 [Ichthyophthirius multifiliis]